MLLNLEFTVISLFRNDDTWEPESNLDCPDIIAAYKKKKTEDKKNEQKLKQERKDVLKRSKPDQRTPEPQKNKKIKVFMFEINYSSI